MKKLDRLPNHSDFAHVTDWVFDLDNTLYPHHVNLFAQIDRNMTAYVAKLLSLDPADAKKLQKDYYRDHGTTLKGLMVNHGVDPNEFLEQAHAIDYSIVPPDPALGMTTVLLVPRNLEYTFAESWEKSNDTDEQIDYVTEDLTSFLRRLVTDL